MPISFRRARLLSTEAIRDSFVESSVSGSLISRSWKKIGPFEERSSLVTEGRQLHRHKRKRPAVQARKASPLFVLRNDIIFPVPGTNSKFFKKSA
jgi:hypothetical protein